MKDIKAYENDVTNALQKIICYMNFLQDQIKEYNKTLLYLQSVGIRDNAIDAELEILGLEMNELQSCIDNIITNDLKGIIKKEFDEIEKVDSFKYPESIMESAIKLFKEFMFGV